MKQDVGFYLHREGPNLGKTSRLSSRSTLSSYHIDALASRLSPDTKDICHDNSTTDGPKNVMQLRLQPSQDEKPIFCHDFLS